MYRVRKGDTLAKIAGLFHTTVEKLLKDNRTAYPIMSKDFICMGWVLKI